MLALEPGAGPEPISPKPVAGRDLYDEPGFFARYQRLRAAAAGDGTLARRLARAGARSVLAVDAAARMLDRAAARPHRRVRYLRADRT